MLEHTTLLGLLALTLGPAAIVLTVWLLGREERSKIEAERRRNRALSVADEAIIKALAAAAKARR
jgi:hypothetical protein